MNAEYKFEPTESRTWFGAKRYNWRVLHRNGENILNSNQSHTRKIDRDLAAWNFYEKGMLAGGIMPPDWAKRP